jgi:hypothetical protein
MALKTVLRQKRSDLFLEEFNLLGLSLGGLRAGNSSCDGAKHRQDAQAWQQTTAHEIPYLTNSAEIAYCHLSSLWYQRS